MTDRKNGQPADDPRWHEHVPSGAGATGARVTTSRRGDVAGEEQERLAAGVGGLLRSLRDGMEWSQAELARIAGPSFDMVQSLELGRVRPEHGTMIRLVRVLVAVEDRRTVLGEFEALAGESWRRWNRKAQPALFTDRDVKGLPPRYAPPTKEQRAEMVKQVDEFKSKLDVRMANLRRRLP